MPASASDPTSRPELPGPYDLLWLSDTDSPVVEDLGLGLACVKSRGNRQMSFPLCPAAIVLPREADPIRSWWQPHGFSPVEPAVSADPGLVLKRREWSPEAIQSTYLWEDRRFTQELSVFAPGARSVITAADAEFAGGGADQASQPRSGGRLVLHGTSYGAATVRVDRATIHVAEQSVQLRPFEYEIRFNPEPASIELVGPEERNEVGGTTHADAQLSWRVAFDLATVRDITVELVVTGAAWMPAATFGLRGVGPSKSWGDYYAHDVPRFETPDARLNVLMDHLAYGYRANELTLGGIFPHRFVMPKETFWNFWMWDSCFHAIAGRWFGNRASLWGNLLNAENAQYPSHDPAAGCINNSAHPYGVLGFISDDPMSKRATWMPHLIPAEHGDGSHLPVFAQALLAVWETTGVDEHMERLLPRAFAYHDWFERTRASESITGLLLVRRWSDSGMDNSKRWGHQGSGIYGTELEEGGWSMPIVTIDLNAFSVLEKRSMARLFDHLGDEERANELREGADQREALLHEHLWDEEAGFYFDVEEASARRVPVWSPIGFLPIVLPGMPQARVSRLLEHLFNERKFWLKAPLPTLAADDPDFRPDHSYWMGPTWMSYMIPILRGLFRRAPEAGWKLLDRMLDYLVVDGNPRVFENYNPLTGQGQDCPDFGWHGMLVDVVLTEMLGLGLDPKRDYTPSPGACRAPAHWGEWRVRNLRARGKRYTVSGRPAAGAPGWEVDVDEQR